MPDNPVQALLFCFLAPFAVICGVTFPFIFVAWVLRKFDM